VIDERKWLITTEPPRWNGQFCSLCNGPVQRHVSADLDDKSELWACACGRTSMLRLPQGKLEFS